MKTTTLLLLLSVIVIVECGHTFLGTNFMRPLVYHQFAKYDSKMFRKRIENVYFTLPNAYIGAGGTIKGILAYDLTNSGASANVTQGGVGYNFVNLRLKSDSGKTLNYDIYIYA